MQAEPIVIPDDPSVVEPIFKQIKNNFKTGGTIPAQYRKHALKKLKEGFLQLKQQFADAHYKDLGINSFIYQLSSHGSTIGQINDLIDNFQSWMKPQSIPTPVVLGFASCSVNYEPLGVALVISAWNYPLYTAVPPAAAAISAGNCVILKPSQMAPYTSKVLKKLFDKYLDPRFYRVVQGKVQVAKAISKLPFDMVCFTGSTFTGRLVAIQAAKNLTPCLLELGGKCPVIVDETAKIESAVLRIIFGKYINCGQICVGVDHVYVHDSIYEKFKELLLTKVKQGYGHHRENQDGDYGKIISLARVNRLEQLLKDNHGGNVIFGGTIDKSKLYISPTIVQKPKKQSLMMSEEIFGPILPLFSYSNLDDVIAQINDRPKPLVVYMFSENSSNIKKVEKSTFSGAYVVNEAIMQMANPHLPFGGVGMSGSGRYHGKSGFINFSNPKSICKTKAINPFPANKRFPPYSESDKSMLMKVMNIGGTTTYSQLYRALAIIVLLITIALVVGLVIVPKVRN